MTNHIPAELLTSSGVYIIRATNSKRVYVGSAVNLKKRFREHFCSLKKNKHHSQLLQRFANKYGITTLRFELLATCPAEALLTVEQTFIVMYRAAEPAHGFNICPVAGSCIGKSVSLESRQKMQAAAIRRFENPAERAKIAKGNAARKHSSATKAKMSATRLGQPRPADVKAKISAAKIGHITSAETRAKISASNLATAKLKKLAL